MLQTIRKLKLGYIIVLMGLVFMVSGFSLKDTTVVESTLLCFDAGCMHVQAISKIALGLFFILTGIYMVLKK